MSGSASGSDRATAFFTSIVAVLAAIGTLFATHRSINALSAQTQGLRFAQQASDQFGYYQSEQVRATIYRAMKQPAPAQSEDRNSMAIYVQAKKLELQAQHSEDRAESMLHSFEQLEMATTLFEIAIAFASIGVLTHVRAPLWFSGILAVIGVFIGVAGYLISH
jgi:hypothetical protein